MEKFDYYINSGIGWSLIEDDLLKTSYINEGRDILEIAVKHKRTPGGIAYRLRQLDIIKNNPDARGYEEYKNSALFKEVLSNSSRPKKVETLLSLSESEINDLSRCGRPWPREEDDLLLKEYNVDKLPISRISNIHKRKESSILSRLRKHNIIKTVCESRPEGLKDDLPIPSQFKECLISDNLVPKEELSVIDQLKEDIRYLKLSIKHILTDLYEMKAIAKNNNREYPVILKKENTIVNTHFK